MNKILNKLLEKIKEQSVNVPGYKAKRVLSGIRSLKKNTISNYKKKKIN